MQCFSSKKEIREHLVNLTGELVRFPSHIDEPRQIFALVDFIKDYFKSDGVDIDEHVFNGLPALFITNKGTKHPHILLSGHIDIVDSAASYTVTVEGDKMHGSATMDMKGGIACMMAVMKYFANQDDAPSIGLVMTSDEETAGDSMLRLLQDEGYTADFCIINEGRSAYDIVVREKGMYAVQVQQRGNDTHSAYPWKADSALEKIMEAYTRIKKDFPEPKNAWAPSASLTMLQGGQKLNVIPGSAEAIFSFRLIDNDLWDRETLWERMHAELPDAELKELADGRVFTVDSKSPYLKMLQEVARKHSKEKVNFAMNHGASEARFTSACGVPTAVLGPVGDNHHSVDEWVSIKSLVWHFEVLREFIEREHKESTEKREGLERGD